MGFPVTLHLKALLPGASLGLSFQSVLIKSSTHEGDLGTSISFLCPQPLLERQGPLDRVTSGLRRTPVWFYV